ncbi:MAG: TauD/TfdA family dioxygenase [Leucothrix sp.]
MSKTFAAAGKPMNPATGLSVWDRAEIMADDSWHYQLSSKTLDEIKANLATIDAATVGLRDINPDNFPLPSFVEQGKAIAEQLGRGRGIAKLAGLDIANYSLDEAKLIYSGICNYIGVTVSQSHLGDYIGEVMDFRNENDDRRYHNGGEFIMHRDPTTDVTGLLSIRQSMEGGYSRLMSASTLHNTLLADYPELMDTIYKGFYYRRTTPDRGTTDLYTPYRIPVFDFAETGEFMSHYIPGFSEFYQQRDELPEDHIEVQAQNAIKDVLWNRPHLYLENMMEPGDMQFCSNRIALHARTDYTDWPEIERARLLLRVWLQLPELSLVPTHMEMFENRDRYNGGIAKLEK